MNIDATCDLMLRRYADTALLRAARRLIYSRQMG